MKVLKISHTNCCQKFSKRRIFTQELTKVLSDTNVTKKPSHTDILAFRHYLFALKNKIKITPDEKKALLKNKNMEFIKETLALLLQKLNIPENISPNIIFDKKLAHIAVYRARYNSIIANPDLIKNYSKLERIGVIRHELQHYLQALTILRHETKGLEWINILAEQNKNEAIGILKKTKTTKEIRDLEKNCYNNHKKYLLEFRDKIIKEKGLIKSGDIEEKKALSYFNQWLNLDYINKDGTVNMNKFYQSEIEQEALISQQFLYSQLQGNMCFFKEIKEKISSFQSK